MRKYCLIGSLHYGVEIMVYASIYVIGKCSWYKSRLIVLTRTRGIYLDSWYLIKTIASVRTPDSHKNKRAQCCPFVGFFKGPPCDCEPLTSKDDWRHQTIQVNTIQVRATSHSRSCWLEGASNWWSFWVVQGPFLLNYHSIETSIVICDHH